tara:strand:- start:18321 stop:18608 length:288 start_codon:yes stop_codon:yes gene_type:complete
MFRKFRKGKVLREICCECPHTNTGEKCLNKAQFTVFFIPPGKSASRDLRSGGSEGSVKLEKYRVCKDHNPYLGKDTRWAQDVQDEGFEIHSTKDM